MTTLVHELQVIRQTTRICMLEIDNTGEIRIDSLRAALQRDGIASLGGPALLSLLQFVLEQGACGEHALVEPLVRFHETYVNARFRRLRENNFRAVCALPSPRSRLVLLKAAYGCPAAAVRDGLFDARVWEAIDAALAARLPPPLPVAWTYVFVFEVAAFVVVVQVGRDTGRVALASVHVGLLAVPCPLVVGGGACAACSEVSARLFPA